MIQLYGLDFAMFQDAVRLDLCHASVFLRRVLFKDLSFHTTSSADERRAAIEMITLGEMFATHQVLLFLSGGACVSFHSASAADGRAAIT